MINVAYSFVVGHLARIDTVFKCNLINIVLGVFFLPPLDVFHISFLAENLVENHLLIISQSVSNASPNWIVG